MSGYICVEASESLDEIIRHARTISKNRQQPYLRGAATFGGVRPTDVKRVLQAFDHPYLYVQFTRLRPAAQPVTFDDKLYLRVDPELVAQIIADADIPVCMNKWEQKWQLANVWLTIRGRAVYLEIDA